MNRSQKIRPKNTSVGFNWCYVYLPGGAVITSAPRNLTVKEGQAAEFPCAGQAHPGNLSVSWFRGEIPIKSIGSLTHRAQIKTDNTLYINKVMAEDQARWYCELTNGIGQPVGASAHLAVECKSIPRGYPGKKPRMSRHFLFPVK